MLLIAAISTALPRCLSVVVLLFIPVGVYNFLHPRRAALWGQRWRWKGDVEPSEDAVLLARLGGIVAILFGIGAAFYIFFFGQ